MSRATAKPRITITTAALYWLLVVCGLVGTTLLRAQHPDELGPLWVGSVLGVTLGQVAAAARIRPWVPLVMLPVGVWVGAPICFYFFEYSGMSSVHAEWLARAFVPALVGGYLSLSERGALVASWYPVVLWMVVILEHPSDATRVAFEPRAALPFLALLTALFVAYFRARETRRVTIWQGHGDARLATDVRTTMLRTSPVRAALSVLSTGAVAGVALLLAWWVAPQLWQREHDAQRDDARHAMLERTETAGERCCRQHARERVREYLPLTGTLDDDTSSCGLCGAPGTVARRETAPRRPLYGAPTFSSYGYSYPTAEPVAQLASIPQGVTVPTGVPGPVTAPIAPLVPAAPVAPPPHVPAVAPPAPLPRTTPSPMAGTAMAPPYVPTITPVLAPYDDRTAQREAPFPTAATFGWLFVAALGGMLANVAFRIVRRVVTLAHLARPFWPEPIDQRVSNHWQRMLVSLRDAGIQEGRNEGPTAFARRVGIDGMELCATILERVRHGVRLEETDLAAMATHATAVCNAARRQAGLSGRMAACLRWPLA